MLEKIKQSLRIKNNAVNDEIMDLINACKKDLETAGVKNIDEEDSLIIQAVKTYCKANYGLDNKDSEKYQASYEMQKQKLSLCGDYNVE